ncbi:MAG: C25 family cysteine peptidase, partial [Bacteroidales bacterium]|nr:C25 family cysteine peptidase [Bacteroidales bacterium]
FITASVQLPAQKDVDLGVVYTEYTDIPLNDPLVPSRGGISRSQDASAIPYRIAPESLIDAFYPTAMAVAEEPYIMRDVRGTTVTVYPFQWNAVTQTLRVYTKVTVILTENDQPATNPLLRENSNPIREVRGMYKSIFINYTESRIPLTMADYGDILVITTARDENAIQPYIDWKRAKGYNVEKEVVAVGTNAKTMIKNKYDANENLMYILLVGGWNEIKSDMMSCWLGSGPSDPMLGDVAGNANDYRPELSIGRMSGNNAAEITVQVNKTIQYERNPNMSTGWHEAFIGIGSPEGPGDDNENDQTHIQRIYTQRLQTPTFTYNTHYQNYGWSPPVNTLVGHVNAGASTIAYCGHGDWNSWGTSGFSNSHINNLNNGEKLPFIVSVACINGSFHNHGGSCFAETWLKKQNGGAVVTWMSTINQPWDEPMRGQDYFYDILIGGFDYTPYSGQNGITTNEQRTHWGSITVNAANLMLSESPGADDKNTVRTWTTFGDPNLQLRTKLPATIVSSNDIISPAINFETTITAAGAPVEDALVCISQNGVYSKGFTNELGQISLEHPFTDGEVLLVITAFNTTTIYETFTLGDAPELFPPINLRGTVEKANRVLLTWDEPTGKALTITGYKLYRDDQLITPEPVRDTRSYTDVVPANGEYKYEATALYGISELESEKSEPAMVIIDGLCIPISSTITLQQEGTGILVSWEAPEYEGTELAGYNILRNTERINTEIIPADELSFLDTDLEPETEYCYQVEVVYNDCEEPLASEEVCYTLVSINEHTGTQSYQIFPNPVDGVVNITGEVAPTFIRIYNITGQLMYETTQCTNNMSISVETMPAGIYFIQIDGVTTKVVFR